MRIAPQTSLAGVTPDDLKDLSPPGAVLLLGTNAARLTIAVTAGAVTGAPYFWADGAWTPLSGDTAIGVVDTRADAASVPVAHQTYRRAAEPRWFAVLKTGAGALSFADISEGYL